MNDIFVTNTLLIPKLNTTLDCISSNIFVFFDFFYPRLGFSGLIDIEIPFEKLKLFIDDLIKVD